MDLGEGLKKIFLAGVGAVATTAEASKELIDNLVKKGEITVEQGKALNEELKQSAKEKMNEHVTVNIVHEYKNVMSAVDHMTPEEREDLKRKLKHLEKDSGHSTESSSSEEVIELAAKQVFPEKECDSEKSETNIPSADATQSSNIEENEEDSEKK